MVEPGAINHLPCVFARALLAHCAVCELARQYADGVRVACADPVARAACAALHGLLRDKSAFALRRQGEARALTRAQAQALQCGGLAGLKQALAPAAHAPDVHRLVRAANERHGGLDALPFSAIVQGVAAWPPGGRKP
jgi:hypothetical protein